uniref:Active breakpoint cluster region-related protein-like n=1 Tax=Sinocyclocheilus grahami TaxID=75366 RepID=A0A672RNU1_SINGR
MELYMEAVDYLKAYDISPVTEDEIVDSELLQDVFTEETEWVSHSPLPTEPCLPSTPTTENPDDLLQKRIVVLKGVLISEEIYLTELETLLTPMKALKAAAGTSQPVLSTKQVQTVFYQIPELRDLHKDFFTSLRARLQPDELMDPGSQQGLERVEAPVMQLLSVGDLFLKFVNQLGVYRGFIDNYENAVEIVQKCMQSDQRFRTLAESMMSSKGSDNVKTKYNFEALLYKPLDRVMKTTLVLHDLWKHTPPDHPDSITLQEALRLSSSFLSGVNERSQCKRSVKLSRGERRQLIRDGFVVDVCENGHNLRHLFLYTDMLLCARLTSAGRQAQYRFCWYLPLVGLKLLWAAEHLPSSEYQVKISKTRAKMYQLNQALQQHTKGGKVSVSRAVDRLRRKLEEWEIWLLTNTPSFTLDLHSTSGKSHTIRLFSLYDLNEWKEAIEKQSGNCECIFIQLCILF